jgi:hypothetical protein
MISLRFPYISTFGHREGGLASRQPPLRKGRTVINGSAKSEEQDASPNAVEAPSGTHFEEFLNEDSNRRRLTKKEQFKSYRAWRSKKGLNWTK